MLGEFDDVGQGAQDCGRAFVVDGFQAETDAAGVLDDTQNGLGLAASVGQEGEVRTPDQVPGHGLGPLVVFFLGQNFDFVGVLLANLADIGMADGFSGGERVAAVEDVFSFSQAGVGIDGQQVDYVVAHLVWLFLKLSAGFGAWIELGISGNGFSEGSFIRSGFAVVASFALQAEQEVDKFTGIA